MNPLYSKDNITIYCGQSEDIRRALPNGTFGALVMDGPANFHADTTLDWLPWVSPYGNVIVMLRDSWAMLGPHGNLKYVNWISFPELTPTPGYTHFAARPVRAIQALLKLTDGKVLDPYMGVGSTLLAAKVLGRSAIGIERDRKWCDIAIQRLDSI